MKVQLTSRSELDDIGDHLKGSTLAGLDCSPSEELITYPNHQRSGQGYPIPLQADVARDTTSGGVQAAVIHPTVIESVSVSLVEEGARGNR